MVNRLRIARLDPRPFRALTAAADASRKQRLDRIIRQHLPPAAASLLAEPVPSADGRFIEWYSDLSGQPVPLAALPADARAAAEARLADRLAALAALAGRLAEAGETGLAAELSAALVHPGAASVYVVDGEPVLTFWGYAAAAATAAPPPPAAAAAGGAAAGAAAGQGGDAGGSPAAPGQGRPRWLLPALAGLALVLVSAGLFATQRLRWPPWGPDYARLLAAAGSEEAALAERLAGLGRELDDRLGHCRLERSLAAATAEEAALAARLAEASARLAAAHGLCPLQAAVATAAAEGRGLDQTRAQLSRDLAKALDDCRKKALAAARQAEAERRREAAEKRRIEAAERAAAEREAAAVAAAALAARPPPPTSEPAPEPPASPSATPRTAAPAAPPAKPARATPSGLPPCPGERTPEEAPDAAIVLDASGSMRLPADASVAEIQKGLSQLGPLGALGAAIIGEASGGPSRLEAAKRGVNSVVGSMPDDVDVGLVTLQRCPGATSEGFFGGSERGRLYARVNGLRPMQGTPLAEGILQAGGMVDGVKAPAIMVVVSDGDDSCGGNPCAAARQLKAQKPLLKINVVDILGNGAGGCMARETGGQILKPGDGLAFEKTIEQAAQDAIKPAHCR
jgi:hypothetical protein